MRLDFNVLWVDDQPRELDPTFIPLRQRMREQGFEFRPTVKSSMEEVKALVADEVFRDEIDLIVVDHQLGGDLRGEDIIFEVRFSVPHKDIIFYSSYTSPSDLRAEAYKKGIEGVYCADKRAIVDEIMSAFESLVKKVLDLDHTRGIVMGATSDIDRMIHASLAGVTKAEEKKFLLFHARRIVEERIVALNEAAAKLKKANDISSLLEHRARIKNRMGIPKESEV